MNSAHSARAGLEANARLGGIHVQSAIIDKSATPQIVLRIHLVGSMQAVSYLGMDMLPRGRKARGILASLCLAQGEWVPRTRLASMLWDSVPEVQARASLRQALRELVKRLSNLAIEVIEMDQDQIRLNMEACWIDTLALLGGGTDVPGMTARELLRLCSGRLMEELDGLSVGFDHWLMTERSRFADGLRVLHEAEMVRLNAPDVTADERVSATRRIVAFDPTNESAYRMLMSSLAKSGDRAQAIREYGRLEEALKATLDIEPSRETRALHEAIRLLRAESKAIPLATLVTRGIDEGRMTAVTLSTPQSPTRPTRLRLGVIPFICVDDRVGGHLPFALTNEVAGALARFRWFDVIAPVGLDRMGEKEADWPRRFRELEVDYMLDGLICSQGDQLAVSVKLLDMNGGAQTVWSETLAFELSALGNFLERIVAPIVARVDPAILFIESRHRSARNISDGTSLLLKAIPLLYSLDRASHDRAGELLEQALAQEPDNAMIPAQRAQWLMWRMGQKWTQSREDTLEQAEAMCLSAMHLDPANALAIATYAHLCVFYHHDFETALRYFDTALRLNPNLALAWAWSAFYFCYVGQPDVALQRLARYRALAPFDPIFGPTAETVCVFAELLQGNYENAASIGKRAVKANPGFTNGYKPVIAALGHLGLTQDAAYYLKELLLREPSFSIEQFSKTYPFKLPDDRNRYIDGLRRAGVPEN